MMLDVNYELRKRVRNLHLNADFIPFSYSLFISGKHSYLGYIPNLGLYPRAAVFDFDGVFEYPETIPGYKLFIIKACEENRKLELRINDIDSSIDEMVMTGNIIVGEARLSQIYRESELTEEQCKNAVIETVKEFKFAKNSGKLISRIKYNFGCLPAIISGSPQMVLEPLGRIIGFDPENIYGTPFVFDKFGRFVGMFLRLRVRKVDAQDIFLQKFVNNMYGCRYFFSDDFVSDAPIAKFGLNPSIFASKTDGKQLPFDVAVCCPEARDNMLNLILRMNRFDFGYVVSESRTLEEENKISNLALDVQDMAKEISSLKGIDFRSRKKSFIKSSVELFKMGERFIDKKHYIKERILRLSFSYDENESKELAADIATFFRDYVAESHAHRGWLDDLVSYVQ